MRVKEFDGNIKSGRDGKERQGEALREGLRKRLDETLGPEGRHRQCGPQEETGRDTRSRGTVQTVRDTKGSLVHRVT